MDVRKSLRHNHLRLFQSVKLILIGCGDNLEALSFGKLGLAVVGCKKDLTLQN
jgi:hypothetical protein